MIAVSNTTPLRYLIAIKIESLLGQLFEKVFIPTAVYEELTDEKTPEPVRHWMSSLPAWMEVRNGSDAPVSKFSVTLHRGEREAIALAESLRSDVLLMDEQTGRAVALSRNLPVSGTLGVLERLDKLGLLNDFPCVLQDLRRSGFSVSDSLQQLLLERHQKRFGK